MTLRLLRAVALLSLASLPCKAAPAPADATDQPVWRATHGVLLAIAHAGRRLVAAGDRGTVLLSDDEGANWTVVPSGTDELLTSLVFTTPMEGFAVGQDATILHTGDAGAHWRIQTTTSGNDQALFSIASLGPAHLIATGAYALMLETQNDGAQWTPIKLPNLDEDYHLNCVVARGQDVVVTGEGGHAFVRHGAGWAPMPAPYEGSQFGCLVAPGGDIYSFGLRGSLFVSKAAAPAWQRIETGEQRSIFGGTVLGNGSMALVGGNGLVMLFDPRTGHRRVLPPPTGAVLSGVVEIGGGRLVTVGGDGVHMVDPAAAPPSQEMTQ